MNDRAALKTFLNSGAYKNKHWRARGFIRMTGFELVCGKVGEHKDTGNPIYGLAPKFSFVVVGPLMLIESKSERDDNALTDEERSNCMQNILFAGIKGSIGRKRRSGGSTKAVKKAKVATPPPSPKTGVADAAEETEGED
jgi:hypothetical protein